MPSSLGELVLDGKRFSAKRALVCGDQTVSYEALEERAVARARELASLGIAAGSHVGLLMPNEVEFAITLFGAALLGAVVVPLNPRSGRAELTDLIDRARLDVLVTYDEPTSRAAERLVGALPELVESSNASALRLSIAPRLRAIVVLDAGQHDRRASPPGMIDRRVLEELRSKTPPSFVYDAQSRVRPDATAMLPFTSGTTSRPKGCMLTHQAIITAWSAAAERLRVRFEDVVWAPCPMFHASGWGALLLTLQVGATWVSDTAFEGRRALELMERERASVLYAGFPAITTAVLAEPDFPTTDLSCARVMLTVGPAGTLTAIQRKFPNVTLVSGYGMTEASGIVSYGHLDDPETERMMTTGRPLSPVEVQIVDPETGTVRPEGQRGEIQYRGPTCFSGYFDDQVATAAVRTDEGWVRSGDLGTMDSCGRLIFEGRLKDMLKVGGENVSPAEVESQLARHPQVKLAQVIGAPDDKYGEVPVAFVELIPEAAVSATDLIEFCRGDLATFKVPRAVRFVDSWPMSATKVQKSVLRQWWATSATPQ